jgi:hypothetical protein
MLNRLSSGTRSGISPCVIDTSARTLLRACLLSGAPAQQAFATWRSGITPETLRGNELRLMPMLLANLTRLGVDDPLLPWLRGMAKHVWLTGMMRRAAVRGALDQLAAASIPIVLVKGSALLARWQDQFDTRPMGDFDLLVPRDHAFDALTTLTNVGWSGPPISTIDDTAFDAFHAFCVSRPHDIAIDVHWRPAEAIADPAHAAGLIVRSEAATMLGCPVRIAGIADHLFVLFAHAFHNSGNGRFDWIAEAAILLRLARAAIDWRVLYRLAATYRMTAWCIDAIALACDISGQTQPSESRRWVRPWTRTLDRFEQRARIDGDLFGALVGRARSKRRTGSRRPHGTAFRDPVILEAAACVLDLRVRRQQIASVGTAALACIGPHGFVPNRDPARQSFHAGWSIPEACGRWTDGNFAWLLLAFPCAPTTPFPVRLSFQLYTLPSCPDLAVSVWAGEALEEWRFRADQPETHTRRLMGSAWISAGGPLLTLYFRFDRRMDPSGRGRIGGDARALGMLLQRIDIATPATIPAFGDGFDVALPLGASLQGPASCEALFWEGWSDAEPNGRWTIGSSATLLLNLSERRPAGLRFDISYVLGDKAGQDIEITVDGMSVGTWNLPAHLPARIDIVLPQAEGPDALTAITFAIARPFIAATLIATDDFRMLGVMLRRITPID